MGFFTTAAIYVALYAIHKYTAPKPPKPREEDLSQNSVPTVQDGMSIPIWYGTVRFDSPNLVWNSPRRKLGTLNDLVVFGSNMKFIMGIPGGRSPVAALTYDRKITFDDISINGVRYDARNLNQLNQFYEDFAEGYNADGTPFTEQDGAFTLNINDAANGIVGTIIVTRGLISTGAFGAGEFAREGFDPFLWPAYRNQTGMMCVGLGGPFFGNQFNVGSENLNYFRYGTSAEIPSIKLTMTNPCSLDLGGGLPEMLPIGGDPNPIAVLYDILTNDWARVGLPASKIDNVSFSAAAETLKAELHGWGGMLTDPTDAANIIRDIMAQINGVLYEDPVTRQFKVKLIRYDYTVASLPLFNESNVAEVVSFMVSTHAEAYNQVRVTYTDRSDNFQTKTAVEQDLASITAQGGRVRSLAINMPHIRERSVAQAVAARELNEVALPLSVLKIRVNRDAFTIRPGDAFRFTWAQYGLTDVVFRALHIDLGTLGNEDVVIDAIQDSYAADNATIGPSTVPFPSAPILPIQERVFTESPRYFNFQANAHGHIGDIDTGRALYLAVPAQTESSGYTVYEYDDDVIRTVADLLHEPQPYPVRAQVETAYSRTLDPYDTTTGLRISGLSDTSVLRVHDYNSIRRSGGNLLLVGREIMAYETFTDLGSGVYRLNNVWRGLFDTPTIAHSVGERVYFLSDGIGFTAERYVGRVGVLPEGLSANGRFLSHLAGIPQGPDDYGVETDRFVSRQRSVLVYPPANVTVDGTKGTSISREGLIMGWAVRNRTTNLVVRGDEPDEVLVDSIQYRVKTQKIGPYGLTGSTYTQVTVNAEPGFFTTTQSGYGQIDCMVASVETGTLDECWEAPRVTMTCPPWRNLLANADFSQAFATFTPAWVVASGAARLSDATHQHGVGNTYVNSNTLNVPIDFSQTVKIDGFYPERMRANLDFYVKTIDGASTNMYEVTLSALDSSGTTLSSTSTGTVIPTTQWRQISHFISALPANTTQIRVRFVGTNDEDEISTIAFADPRLQVGQFGVEQVSNGNFESGLAGWTTATGTFSAVTTAGYSGNTVAQGGTGTTNEIFQDDALPLGLEFGTAVLFYAIGKTGTVDGDAGQVTLEARDGGGVVLATISTTPVEPSPGAWSTGFLALDNIPVGTANIRIRLIATRTAAGTSTIIFDSISMYYHKHLDPDSQVALDFRTPRAQARPLDRGDWFEAFPSVPMPDYGMFTGGNFHSTVLRGRLGIEPTMSADSGARVGKFVGFYDAESGEISGPVVELQSTDSGIVSKSDSTLYGNFSASESFSVLCFFRSRRTTAGTHGLCGRIDASENLGWSLEVDTLGFVQARLEGSGATIVATRGAATHHGAPWMAWLIYDASTQTLHCVDPTGVSSLSASTVGEFKTTGAAPFMIGKSETGQTCLDGQIDVYVWRRAITTTQAQSIWTHGLAPVGVTVTNSARTGNVIVPVDHDSDGELLAVYAPSQLPYGKTEGTSSTWGMANPVAVTNLAPHHDFRNTTSWPREGSPTVTVDKQSPLGFLDAMSITGNNTAGVRSSDFALSATVNVHFVFYARSPGGAHNFRFQLLNSSGVVKGTFDIPVGEDWARYEDTFTTWDASTASGRIKFFASDDATSRNVEIAGPVFVNQGTDNILAVPYGGAVTDSTITITTALPLQFSHEGEIYVDTDGLEPSFTAQRDVVIVDNAVNNNDARTFRISSSNQAQLIHNDGAAASNTATSATIGWDVPRIVRARWCRATLRDISAGNGRTAIRVDNTSTVGRTLDFTPSSTALSRTRLMPSGLLIPRIVLFARELGVGQIVP